MTTGIAKVFAVCLSAEHSYALFYFPPLMFLHAQVEPYFYWLDNHTCLSNFHIHYPSISEYKVLLKIVLFVKVLLS